MKTRSFIDDQENADIRTKFAHLIDGVNHYTNDARLNLQEQNKMAIMLESIEQEYCSLKRITPAQLNDAVTVSGDFAPFVKQQMPLIRKVYPNMISREFVSVQPMSMPNVKLFYYDIQREDGTSLSTDVHNQRTYADNVEYNPSAPTAIKRILPKITSSSIDAEEKKLIADWTRESAQDLYAYHGMSVESDLSDALGTEIVMEWDRVVIEALLNGATGGSKTFDLTVPTGIGYADRKVWMEMLWEACIDVDTQIYKKRFKKTNVMIVPATIAGFIEKMAGFKADPVSVDIKIAASGGRYFMGTMNNRYRIYCDPFFPEDKILMLYNNPTNWMDTAFVWAPYILAYFSSTFENPNTFLNSKAILSRAAMKMVVGDLAGVVTLQGS